MKLQILILNLMFFFVFTTLNAQKLVDDTQEYDILVFEHLEKEKTHLLRAGGWVKYRLYSNPKVVYKGTFQKATGSSMFVDGKEIKLADCSMIAARVRSDKEIVGSLLLGMGAATAPMGGAVIAFVGGIGGPAIIAGGVVLASVGLYLLMKKRFFRMDKGWSVYGGSLSFERSYN